MAHPESECSTTFRKAFFDYQQPELNNCLTLYSMEENVDEKVFEGCGGGGANTPLRSPSGTHVVGG